MGMEAGLGRQIVRLSTSLLSLNNYFIVFLGLIYFSFVV